MVMAIMLVITGTGYYSVSQFTQNQGLGDDQKSIIAEMKRAYAKATGVYYPSGCTGLTGYRVAAAQDSKDMTVTALCGSGNVAESRRSVLKGSLFTATTTFTFTVGTGVVGTPVVLTIKDLIDATKTKSVTINNNGVFIAN